MSVPPAGAVPAIQPALAPFEGPEITERFSDRARALFYARLAFLAIGLSVLAVPAWSRLLGFTDAHAFLVYMVVIAYSVANFFLIDHPRLGRPITAVTLSLDLVTLGAVVLASGGLRSPLMAAHVMLTLFFVLFFPRWFAVLPGFVFLPVVVALQGGGVVADRVFLVVWYTTLGLITAYVLLYLDGRDKRRVDALRVLNKAQESAVVNEERLRLAREIHDGLGGQLSTLIIQAEYIQRMAAGPSLRTEATELKRQAEEAIDELRRSLTMMRRDFDLHQTLDDHCVRFEERHHVRCGFKVRGRQRRLPSDMQLALFRILQECLTNTQKHADASKCDVRLKYDGDLVSLTVTDDGKGFEVGRSARDGHYGLTNLEERARRFRGTLDIQSAPGAGTTVHATLVIPEKGSHVAFLPEA